MGTPAPQSAETLVQLVLRAYRDDPLIQTEGDWGALGSIAARTLFWCGGAIYACRCEGNQMRFALQVQYAPLGTYAHQIAGLYAIHLRRTREISGRIFRHYSAIPTDEVFLDDLVLWLHRSENIKSTRVWTADSAYLKPNSLPWISTDRVLSELSIGAPGPATYRRRRSEAISPQSIERFTRRAPARLARAEADVRSVADAARPSLETISRLVAKYCQVSYQDMLTDTRKRALSKARVIATVLATRNGATAASAARWFNRSRSALIEQVEHYRLTQPDMFEEAESRLESALAAARA